MKVSIIVPVYNAEKYLDKCVESITKQTEEDIEILLIDDDSTDSSGRMCEEWAKKDSRIRVFHIENIGVSNARNQGIKNSNSPYIMFVDSDDWIKKDMVGCLLKNIEESKSQAVFCNYITVRDGDKIVTSNISDKYLQGILIGYAKDVEPDSNNLTQSGYLVPAVDFNNLQEVLIITEMKNQ